MVLPGWHVALTSEDGAEATYAMLAFVQAFLAQSASVPPHGVVLEHNPDHDVEDGRSARGSENEQEERETRIQGEGGTVRGRRMEEPD